MEKRQSIMRKHVIAAVEVSVLADKDLSLGARGLYALLCAQSNGQLPGDTYQFFIGEHGEDVAKLSSELINKGLASYSDEH